MRAAFHRSFDEPAPHRRHLIGALCSIALQGVVGLAATPASAFGVNVCNKGDAALRIAIVGEDGFGGWYSSGWYAVDPGQCWNRGSIWEYQFYLAFA